MTTAMRYAHTADGADVAYAVVGDGPPVVFAGAFTAAGLDVTLASAPYMAEFEPLQHRALVLFDWRGLGASGPADRFTSGGFVNDLAAVVDTIGDDPVDLLGESFGAHAAAVYAAKHPERVSRLALMPIRPAPHSPRTSLRFAEIAHIADADWPRFAELFSLIAFGWVDPELVRVQHARMMTQLDADRWRELNEAVEALDGIKVASQLVMPTLAQIAEPWAAETKTAVRRFVGALPDGRLTTELTPAVPTGSSAAARNRAAVDFFDEGRGAQRDDPGDRTGLQTVLFTDLTGSTAMQSRLGDGAAHAIVRAHDAAVRLALGGFHGREVKHTGDGIMAAFGSAAEAVSCALAVKRDIATYNDTHEGEELLVRFGLNAGEPIAERDDLFGLSVTLAARIGDWGEPGQVLCSNVVRELLLGKGFAFTSVGSAELKGLDEPVPLYEVS